jgi:hypothetical protein
VAPGRAFLRRLIGGTIPLKAPHRVTRVNKSIKGDLNMWLTFLENYNGVSVFRDQMVADTTKQGLLIHYLDDYLFVGKETSGHCKSLLETFHNVCHYLNVPIAHEKTEGPVKEIVFLGLKINSVLQNVTIPEAKLLETKKK